MPTLAQTNLPTPKSWEEFEEITLDALKIKWDNPNLQRHGRTGQAQAAVDIYGEDNMNFQAGVQCKKHDSQLTMKTIEAEIKNAEKFTPALEIFYIATTLPTDAKLQKSIRILSKKRKDMGMFPVGIYFWNDIVHELVANEVIFKKHFPQINLDKTRQSSKRLFSILDISFHGLSIQYYSELLYGEFGANLEDPRTMEIVFSHIQSASLVTCTEAEQAKIKSGMDEYLSYVMPVVTGLKPNADFHWKFANDIADRIKGHIASIIHSLNSKELVVYRIGEMLGIWNSFEFHKEDSSKSIGETFLIKLKSFIEQLNDGKLLPDIKILFDTYRSDVKSHTFIVDKFYNKIRQALIEAEIFKN